MVEVWAHVAAAWAKFNQVWPLIGKRDGNIDKRLRLFDMCVSQTLFWCNESWHINKKERQLLQTMQHRMLRRIAGPRCDPDELGLIGLSIPRGSLDGLRGAQGCGSGQKLTSGASGSGQDKASNGVEGFGVAGD